MPAAFLFGLRPCREREHRIREGRSQGTGKKNRMGPDRNYFLEKMHQTVSSLVDGDCDLKPRLASAGLTLTIRGDDYVPEEYREQFTEIIRDLKRCPAETSDESSTEATVREMTIDEAREMADRILNLYVRALRGDV